MLKGCFVSPDPSALSGGMRARAAKGAPCERALDPGSSANRVVMWLRARGEGVDAEA